MTSPCQWWQSWHHDKSWFSSVFEESRWHPVNDARFSELFFTVLPKCITSRKCEEIIKTLYNCLHKCGYTGIILAQTCKSKSLSFHTCLVVMIWTHNSQDLCAGNPLVTIDSHHWGPLIRGFGVFFVGGLNKLSNKQSNGLWNSTPWLTSDVALL